MRIKLIDGVDGVSLFLEDLDDPQETWGPGKEKSRALLECDGQMRIAFALPSRLLLPEWALEGDGQGGKFLSKQRVADKVAAEGVRIKTELIESLRRYESVQVVWGDSHPFLGATAQAHGEAKLRLSQWLFDDAKEDRIAEFAIRGSFEVVAAGGGKVSVAVACVVRDSAVPTLRLDLDDLNFSFPEFEFPKLDFGAPLKWPNTPGLSRIFNRLSDLASQVDVAIVADPTEPALALALDAGALRWALARDATLDWAQPLAPQLASFDVTLTRGASSISVKHLKVAGLGTQVHAEHDPPTGSIDVGTITVKTGRLGPVTYRVEQLKLSAHLMVDSVTAAHVITARVSFARLELRLADDPQTVIAFKGQVLLTPSATAIESLELIEPYPLKLVAAAADALLRGARAVVSFLASLEGPDAPDLDQLRKLLEILGRFAAAIARAALWVGERIVDASQAAAALLGKALDALAEGLAAILAALKDMVPSGEVSAPPLQIEVRLGLDPIELRQVLITRKNSPTIKPKFEGLGLTLSVEGAWRPGLLLDFVDNPGAYVVLSRGATADAEFATLGTDLWLESASAVSHMPDADPVTGERPVKRLIALTAGLEAAGQGLVVVVVGLQRGKPVFLQRMEGKLTPIAGTQLAIADGRFALSDLADSLTVKVDLEKDRLLPLLGMGETGKTDGAGGGGTDGFLNKLKDGLGQVVWVEKFVPPKEVVNRTVTGSLLLGVKAAGVSTQVNASLTLSLDTMRVKLDLGQELLLKSRRIEEDALGLTWVIEQKEKDALDNNKEVEMFKLSFVDGESGFGLNTDVARMELRFGGLSGDGQGVVFEVTEFFVGRGGVDITAKVTDKAVRLNGLDVPFRFQTGHLKIRGGRLVDAAISGRGTLPPALVGEADCTLALAFSQDALGIVLQSGKVEIDKKGEPIVCHSTRFTLTISDLDVGIQKDGGGYHFYFLVTGSLRFTPKPGEFEGGLLGFLGDIEMNLERTPLTGDARVLGRHISFQKALTPKKSFPLFNLFTFELRGFGFHPSSPRFGGSPAINLSGQIKFAEIGDVVQPRIDFHGLWIAPPRPGEALPRISAEGLGVDLQLSGSVKVRGSVLAVDPSTRTVEGREFAPPGYDTYGFLGSGEVEIPGWGSMLASLGFLEIEHKSRPGDRRKAFFVYLQKNELAVKIPTGFWTFYMREAGFGFGFRYTLAGIRGADEARTPAQLIRVLDDVSKRQGDLARFSSWSPDPEGDRFTLALRAAVQAYPANETYDAKTEEAAENPFFFDMIVALRSDLTLLASMRGYLGVNYADFRANKDNFRERPGLRGYLYISAPRSELLARMVGDSKGHIGERFPGLQKGQVLRRAVESVDWSATLYIRPGLFHYELGWPDQLAVRLVDSKNMKVTLRGGMIFRVADDGLLWGYNIEADAWLAFGGSTGGSIGVAVEASLQARFVARLIAYLSWRFQGSMVYGLVALDASLAFSVRAWMEVDLGFTSFTLRIGFSYAVQFSAAIELAITTEGVGGRANARIAVAVFGCTLSVGVGFAFNDRLLDDARRRVQRFMAMSITADEPDAAPAAAIADGDTRVNTTARQEERGAQPAAPLPAPLPPSQEGLKPGKSYAGKGRKIEATNFWMVLHAADPPAAGAVPNKAYAYALLVPRERERDDTASGFYASPWPSKPSAPPVQRTSYSLTANAMLAPGCVRIDHAGVAVPIADTMAFDTRWTSLIPVDTTGVTFSLDQLFDECFLTDTVWEKPGNGPQVRHSTDRQEPEKPRSFKFLPSTPGSRNDVKRAADLGEAQREHAADAASYPCDDRAYQARSTVMTLFLDQFVAFAKSGSRVSLEDAHVLDLGLVFYGPVDELERLAATLKVTKQDQADLTATGEVKVLNGNDTWFDKVDPVFAQSRRGMGPNGLGLGWDLSLPFAHRGGPDPDHFLHHYEIKRTVEGYEPRVVNVKPAATIGRLDGAQIELHRAEWQYVDDFSDLPAAWRRALLPSSNESDALASAQAWIGLGLDDDVTLTYTVTPVDIAGTHGLPKSFLHTVERPVPPIRAAKAEIRVVQTLVGDKEAEAPLRRQHTAERPADISVWFALDDPAWDTESPNPKVRRSYELIIEQETVLPAGAYAAGGATDRVGGLGSAGAHASPHRFIVGHEQLKAVRLNAQGDPTDTFSEKIVTDLEGDTKTLEGLKRWGLLADNASPTTQPLLPGRGAKLLDTLWSMSGDNNRAAARFWLRTRIEFLAADGKPAYVMASQPVAVPCEIRLQRVTKAAVDRELLGATALRPDAFEWPVHLRLPPLVHGQVRVKTGFLHQRAPARNATLSDWVGANPGKAIVALRDPGRRTVTHLEFDAVPAWADDTVAPVHRASIAGYDLHELDIDDLAALDTSGGALSVDTQAWKRARRVAQIELLAPEEASLSPAHNADWLGWQAQYPSETWRVERSPSVGQASKAGGRSALPARKAWYTASESTPCFATRPARRRLLPLPPEAVVTELMHKGWPVSIRIALGAEAGSAAEATLADRPGVILVKPPIDGDRSNGTDHFKLVSGLCTRDTDKPFDAAALRYLLLCLCWNGPGRADMEPAELTGLRLELNAETQHGATTTVIMPLDFGTVLHPVLEEVTAALALAATGDDGELPTVYRAYEVMAQPTQPVDARELNAFMAGTGAGVDPYGWGVLQALGLSSTIRIFDKLLGQFMPPLRLAAHVKEVFEQVLRDWQQALGGSAQPFAEVLLKPGADRLLRPFDGKASAADKSYAFDRDADGLAMIQLSLRPVPQAAWHYLSLKLDLGELLDELQVPPGSELTETRRLRSLALQLKHAAGSTASFELLHPPSMNLASLTADAMSAALALPLVQTGAPIRLVVRCEGKADQAVGVDKLPGLVRRLHAVVEITKTVGKNSVTELKKHDMEATFTAIESVPRPDAEGASEAFDSFKQQPAEAWAKAVAPGKPAHPAFDSLMLYLRIASPAFVPPTDEKTRISAMGQYPAWAQRFLDHGAVSSAEANAPLKLHLALAAPTKASPWRLAPDAAGCVRLYIPSDDRWAHARAYAVKPLSRYAHLMAAVGVLESSEREQLVTPDVVEAAQIGYAVAVAPRTERVEPPVILASAIHDESWEVVLARHGEESLAMSNRPLFARLGSPDIVLAQLRTYRWSKWPAVLGLPAMPKRHPRRVARLPYPVPESAAGMLPERLQQLALEIPSLWKGADVASFRPVPPHYKVVVLAAARAGIVVSNVVSMVQDDLPRRALRDLLTLPPSEANPLAPSLAIVRSDDGRAVYKLEHRLVSHHDLTPPQARQWNTADPDDICWWPDPDVSYQLLHESTGSTIVSEEISDTRLVADGAPGAKPVIVRARGTRWKAKAEPHIAEAGSGAAARRFVLRLEYTPIEAGPAAGTTAVGLSEDDLIDPHLPAFAVAIEPFGLVIAAGKRSFGLARMIDESDEDYENRVKGYVAACTALKQRLHDASFDTAPLTQDADLAIEVLGDWLAAHPETGAAWLALFEQALQQPGELKDLADDASLRYVPAGLQETVEELHPLRFDDEPSAAPLPPVLLLFDVPADDELNAIRQSGHPLAERNSRFWKAVAQRISGGATRLRLKAVDGRARPPAGGNLPHPGIAAEDVAWPEAMAMVD